MLQIDIIRLYKSKKFLVIDDFPDIRASIKRMMTKFGADHVDTASNGEEAMEMCMNHSYDVILCDYNLGEQKSGQQLLEEMRFRQLIKHSSLYLMITAETTRDKVYSAIEHQPDAYIAKPFSPPYLQKRLDALLIAKEAMGQINEAADTGDYDQAISLCEEKIACNDKYRTLCIRLLGHLYLVTKQYDKAVAVYRGVLAERSMAWALIGLGKALVGDDRLDEAEDVFKSLAQEQCPCIDVYDSLAEVLSKKGSTVEAQAVLEMATDLSPDTILRQRELAAVSEINDDLERAEKAHKKVVRLGVHSVHEQPDNYFDYVNCLNKISKNTSQFDKKRYEEANTMLQRVSKRFKNDVTVQVRSRYIKSETAVANGKEEVASGLLKDAETYYEKAQVLEDEAAPEVMLARAKAMHANGDVEKAKKLLEELAANNSGNEDVINAIDNCLDEPVSKVGKQKMVEFNREGKKLFEGKNFSGAIDYFNKALRIFPNHVALNLNLALAIMKDMEIRGKDDIYVARCRRVLAKLSHLDESHKYYKLYTSLSKQASKL